MISPAGPWLRLLLSLGAGALWLTVGDGAAPASGTGTESDRASPRSGDRLEVADGDRDNVPGKSTHRPPSGELLRDKPYVKASLAFQDGDLDQRER